MILGLDPGTVTGWALGEHAPATEVSFSGIWQLGRRGASQGQRFGQFDNCLAAILRNYDVKLVAYEMAHHRGGPATALAGGLVALIEMAAYRKGIETMVLHSSTIKKHATGRGNAEKSSMVEAGRRKFTLTTAADDEVDALWIYDLAKLRERETAKAPF